MTTRKSQSTNKAVSSNYSDDDSQPPTSQTPLLQQQAANQPGGGGPSNGSNESSTPLTWSQSVCNCAKSLVLEPGLLVYMIATVMGNLIASDLQLHRACHVNLKYDFEICDQLLDESGSKEFEDKKLEVERLVSDVSAWVEAIENFSPILFSLFLGGWTDVYGTKFPFLLSIGGIVVRYAGLLLCAYNDQWDVQIVSLFSELPGSFTGGQVAISMIIYSFVAATTSVEDRTVRVGILTFVRAIGRSAGCALGALLKKQRHSYFFIFGTCGGLAMAAFIYSLLFLPNPKKGSNPYHWDRESKWEAMKNIFNFRNIAESAKSFFKERPYGIRTQLYLLVIILIFNGAPTQGEDSVLNLFVRLVLEWTTADFGIYQVYRMFITFIGGIVSVGLLVQLLRLTDWKIGIISCLSQIGGCLVYAFVNLEHQWMMFVAPIVDILNGTMLVAARTMISKIIPITEIGKVNCFVAIIDATTPFWANSLYLILYSETLEHFPGAFMILSALFTLIPAILFAYFGMTKLDVPIEEQIAMHEEKE